MDNFKYCQNPELYVDLPESTKKYYDRICHTREKVDSYWQQHLDKFGNGIIHLPKAIIHNILSPHGLEMLSLCLGVDITSKVALTAIYRTLANGISPVIMAAAARATAEEGALFVNNRIICTMLSLAVEEGTVAATAFSIIRAISSTASVATTVMMIVQFLGIIIDLWDPEGYANETGAETMEIINSQFDSQFMTQFINLHPVGVDRYNKPIHYASWPIEYKVANDIASPQKTMHMFSLAGKYATALLNAKGKLTLNPNRVVPVTSSTFKDYANSLNLALGNNNTVVVSWIRKHVLFICIVVGIVLFFLFIPQRNQ
jgi:hypothetical protein